MARFLIVGGGCRGLALTRELVAAGHAVRVTTRSESGRAAIEGAGGECWIGDPDRIASLRQSLDGVTVACWLLGTAAGDPETVAELHGSRLDFMLGQLIDTTVRGLVYEAAGSVAAPVLREGARRATARCALNAIPLRVLEAQPGDTATWMAAARSAVATLLAGPSTPAPAF